MPAVSRKQFKFMKAVENGDIKVPGLSEEKAAEYTSENHDLSKLPEEVKPKRFKKLFKVKS
jgi:hypothetical protein